MKHQALSVNHEVKVAGLGRVIYRPLHESSKLTFNLL
jgi:hypothetical protein